jgi:hypothetical protein
VHENGVFARFRYNDLKEADRGCGGRGHYASSMVGRSGVEVPPRLCCSAPYMTLCSKRSAKTKEYLEERV